MAWAHSEACSCVLELQGGKGTGRRLGIAFHGTNETLAGTYSTFKLSPEGDRLDPTKLPEPSIPPSPGHTREWLDGIKTRRQPSCHFGYHYWIQLAISLGAIAFEVGRRVAWDDAAERVVNDEDANRLLAPVYRRPWAVPQIAQASQG